MAVLKHNVPKIAKINSLVKHSATSFIVHAPSVLLIIIKKNHNHNSNERD